MRISELMTKEPIIISEKATLLDAIKKMQAKSCGILPIGEDIRHIKGVITDRDILIRAVAQNKDVHETTVAEAMSNHVMACEEEGFVQQVIYKMNKHRIRRVLVKDKSGALSGIVSLGDIVRRVEDKDLLARLFKEAEIA